MKKDVYAEKPWMKSYNARVSRKLDYPSMSLPAYIEKAINKYPDRIAFYYGDLAVTFKELDAYGNKFANFLIKSGLKKGDVVGINSLNTPAYLIAELGILKAGCVQTGVSPLYKPEELLFQLNNCNAKVLVTLDFLWGNVKQILAKTEVKAVVIAGLFDFLPDAAPIPEAMLKDVPEVKSYRFVDVMKDMPATDPKVEIDPDSVFLIQYTGGTTGLPKGAQHSHRSMLNWIVVWANWIDVQEGKDYLLSPFPMFHVGGQLNGLLGMAKAMTQILIANPRDVDNLLLCILKYKPAHINAVPTLWLELLKRKEFCEMDFSGIRICCSASAPFPAEYVRQFAKIVGENKLKELWGFTESLPISMTPPEKFKAYSVGVPITDCEVKVVDPDTNEIMPLGEVGELAVRGICVPDLGYYNNPAETANLIRGGWMHTGDLGYMDEDGFIFIVDRLKDMINVSGMKVFTRELDDAIVEHPDVELAASIGVPDPQRPGSERVASVIVLKPGIDKSDEEKEKLLAFLKQRVAPYKVPKVIEFVDQLPLSSVGKILKRELRETLGKKLK